MAARRAEGRTSGLSPRSVDPILAMLTDAGALTPELPAGPALGGGAAAGGLRASSAVRAGAGRLDRGGLCGVCPALPGGPGGGGLDGLTAADVTGAVLAEAETVSASSAQYFVAALRAFLRFCFLEGLVEADLAGAALAVTGRRRVPLPRGISRADARALLAACDRRRRGRPPRLRRA